MSGTDGYRYPGPNEFEDTPADHLLFSGRDDEINAITQQIVSSRLLVLYGSSGLGKSSLLKAGVYPKLRENNFCPVRVRITDKLDVLQLIAECCAETGREAELDYTPGVGSTPWEFFKTSMFWRGETLLYPVLIFDQFEELFTSVRPEWKKDFANEIGPLASGNLPDSVRRRLEQGEKGLTDTAPQVKLIFSLREEFYGSLEELSTDFPALFQDRFRLLPMDRSRAELAIRQPALKESEGGITFNTPPFTYDNDTITAMLGFLSGRHGTIEPFQLQLLCQHIERVVVPEKLRTGFSSPVEITPADLGGERVMSDLVRRFYTDSLAQLPVLEARRARELCDTGLLSSDGHRLMLEKNEILRNYRISEETLRHLIDRRILREEPRLDSLFYEIGHDTIAHSILKTRRIRLPRKYRLPAAVVASLVVLFTSYVIVTNFRLRIERNHERDANKTAQEAKTTAEDARAKAEKLASYLIGEDLMDAIKPIGRIEVLESVEKQIDEYLGLLKLDQTGETSDRALQIEGLARLNRGDLDYMQEKISQAGNEYEEARSVFEQLVKRNPDNPEWLHNLADAEAKLAGVASDQFRMQQSLDLYQQALGHIQKALAGKPSGITDKLRDKLLRDEADTYQNIGGALYQQRHFEGAIAAEKRAVALATGQQTTQWTYIREDALIDEGIIFESQGQEKAAEEVLENALEIAKSAARMNPFDPEAQRRLGLAENHIANFNMYRRDPEQVLAQYKSLNNIMQQAIDWEPRNERWQADYAYTFLLLAEANNYAKRSEMAEKQLQQAIPRFERIRQIDQSNASLTSDLADSYRDWGNILAAGNSTLAVQHFKESLKLLTDLRQIDSTNTNLVTSSAATLFDMADALDTSPDEALAASKQGIQLMSTLGTIDPSDSEYWELVSLLHRENGSALRAKKDDQAAGVEFQESLNAIDKAIQSASSSSRYLNGRSMLRSTYLATKETDPDGQIKDYRDAIADSRKAVELDPNTGYYFYYLARAQSALGDVLAKRREYDSALASYADAEQSYKKGIQVATKEDAKNYQDWLYQLLEDQMAPLRAQRGDKQGALRAYEEAVQIMKSEADANPSALNLRINMAVVLTGIADRLGDYDMPAPAFGYYTDAAQIYSNAIGTADKNSVETYRTDLFQVFSKHVAPLRAKQRDLSGAKQACEEAAKVKSAVVTEHKDAAYQSEIARACEEAGGVLTTRKQFAEANDLYEYAAESWRNAIQLHPSADEWDGLASLYYNSFATLSDKQNNDAATLKYYRQAADTEKEAATLAPNNATYHSNLGYAYKAIADNLAGQQDPSKAELEYNQSQQWFNKAISLDKTVPSYWYGLALTSVGMAEMHEKAGDLTAAKHCYEQAQKAAIKAGELDPKTQDYKDERASVETKLRQLAPQ